MPGPSLCPYLESSGGHHVTQEIKNRHWRLVSELASQVAQIKQGTSRVTMFSYSAASCQSHLDGSPATHSEGRRDPLARCCAWQGSQVYSQGTVFSCCCNWLISTFSRQATVLSHTATYAIAPLTQAYACSSLHFHQLGKSRMAWFH